LEGPGAVGRSGKGGLTLGKGKGVGEVGWFRCVIDGKGA
jgi:hypothetical protein